jgi:dienelactone hydrolase
MIRKTLRILVLSAPLCLAALLFALWLEHRASLTLPAPTGPFPVGRSIYDWLDPATPDSLSPVPGARRELLVWIWYPAATAPAAAPAAYLPAAPPKPPLLFRLLTRDPSKVHGHSLCDPDVSPRQPSYPVVILRGGASLEVSNYSTLAEDLASHGYIVVGLDAPYRTLHVAFPDGRVIARTPANNPELYSGAEFTTRANQLLAAWTADMSFVLDRLAALNASDTSRKFTGRLDLQHVGAFGHSFGGAQSAQFCQTDLRCQAGIDIDGALLGSVLQTGIHKPFMFLLSGNGDFSSASEIRQFQAEIQSVYDRLPPNGRLRLVIRGANHFTFTDDGALLKSHLLRGVFRVFGMLGIDGRRQLAVTAYCVRTFFDACLKGAPVSPPRIDAALYPEIQIQ